MQDIQTTSSRKTELEPVHTKGKTIFVTLAVFIVLVLFVILFLKFSSREMTPEQDLQNLRAVSTPSTQTSAEVYDDLSNLRATNKPK